MALSEADRRELQRRADRLSSLLGHPGWAEFEAENKRKVERLRHEAMLMAISAEGADQRKLDEIRGQMRTLRWQNGLPHHAQVTLERFLTEQGIPVEEDENERNGI